MSVRDEIAKAMYAQLVSETRMADFRVGPYEEAAAHWGRWADALMPIVERVAREAVREAWLEGTPFLSEWENLRNDIVARVVGDAPDRG